MDKYKRVPKEKVEQEKIQPNEVRVLATSQRGARNYITYALNLLQAEGEGAHDTITLRAMGRAINKAISIAEIVKRRVPDLHQITSLESSTLVDSFEPLVQGLDPKEVTRTVSCIAITLSKKELDKTNPGYQPPLPPQEVQTEEAAYAKKLAAQNERNANSEGRGRGVSRGRGGGGRGRGRSSSPRGGGRGGSRGGGSRGGGRGSGRGSARPPPGGRGGGGGRGGRGTGRGPSRGRSGPPRGGRGGRGRSSFE